MIDAKIEHIEDITADNRAVIIKLVKQNNQIVEFLKNLQVEIEEDFDINASDELNQPFIETNIPIDKMRKLKDLVEEFMDKQQDLKEFEEELRKHKGQIIPGQIGES